MYPSNENRTYKWLPAPAPKATNLQRNRQHDRHGLLSGIVSGTFRTITDIHISTGLDVRPQDLQPRPANPQDFGLVKPFYREINPGSNQSERIIPGSSWRGVLRSTIEAITPSAFGIALKRYAQVPREYTAIKFKDADRKRGNDPVLDEAQKIFGAEGYKSHLTIDNLHCENTAAWEIIGIEARWTPREVKEDARKIYLHMPQIINGNDAVEVCPANVHWHFRMSFHQLDKAQIGLILLALGQKDPFYLKVGGGKSQGLGTCLVESVALEFFPQASFRSFETQLEPNEDKSEFIDAGEALLYKPNYQKLIEWMRP